MKNVNLIREALSTCNLDQTLPPEVSDECDVAINMRRWIQAREFHKAFVKIKNEERGWFARAEVHISWSYGKLVCLIGTPMPLLQLVINLSSAEIPPL